MPYFIVISPIETLFTTDEEYQALKDYLIDFGEQHPICKERVLREIDLSDELREVCRSNPELLEKIRQRIIEHQEERKQRSEPDEGMKEA